MDWGRHQTGEEEQRLGSGGAHRHHQGTSLLDRSILCLRCLACWEGGKWWGPTRNSKDQPLWIFPIFLGNNTMQSLKKCMNIWMLNQHIQHQAAPGHMSVPPAGSSGMKWGRRHVFGAEYVDALAWGAAALGQCLSSVEHCVAWHWALNGQFQFYPFSLDLG